MLLKNCRFVVTWTEEENLAILENVDIKIHDNKIVEIGKDLKPEDDCIVDCSRRIVIPGLVNAHTHSPMVMLRGYCDDLELHEWLSRVWEVERHLNEKLIELGTELAIAEMLSTGTTAFIDMYFYPHITAQVAKKYGIRTFLGPPFIEALYSFDKCLKELEHFIKEYYKDELVRPIVNVHSIYTCSIECIKNAYDIAIRNNTIMHIHVSETRKEVYECKKKFGKFPVELLNDIGVLSRNTHLVHLGWVTSREIEIIREKDASVTHCPVSNMKLATAGFFPFYEMIQQNIRVTIGTDGAASNNSLDMFREIKTAVLLQRNNYWDTRIKAIHVLKAATLNGYKVLGIDGGTIAKGKVADLVMLDLDSIYIQPIRRDNLVSNIVYSATGRDVASVIINGKIVYDRERDYEKWYQNIINIREKLNKFIEQFVQRHM